MQQQKGKLKSWKDEQGFGFIQPEGGGPQVFVHISAFKSKHRRPDVGEPLLYHLGQGKDGKPCAVKAQFVNNEIRTPAPGRGWPVPIAVALVFLGGLGLLVYLDRMSVVMLGIYLVASALALLVYEMDKTAARNGRSRISENVLLLIGLLGGWPGAWVAQRLLRHKSRKTSFQVAFWITVAINCAALGYLLYRGVPGLA